MNLPVAPFYVMPPDKAAAIKILLYQLTAGWCKVGYSTPMNVKLSKTPPFTNPPNVACNISRTFTLNYDKQIKPNNEKKYIPFNPSS
jgi:hypothetical protein